MSGAPEELCRVPLHVLGAPEVSAMLGKCVHLRLSVLHVLGAPVVALGLLKTCVFVIVLALCTNCAGH